MSRTGKPSPAPASASHLFGGRKANDRGATVTRARIEADLAAFRKAGGRIEVLGVTRSLTRIDPDADAAAKTDAAAAPKPAARGGRR
ncbi:hypothetical protein [Luteimonas huabeiensis]|uniref:hypothetical protein n=1 Tax=Luteimonas huabeiensis TaxID=1244513 RepID=UPI000463DBEA|nr:hypothetical protein [Luteimonas huabeiensis]